MQVLPGIELGAFASQANQDTLFADVELANSGDSTSSKGGHDCDNAAPQIGQLERDLCVRRQRSRALHSSPPLHEGYPCDRNGSPVHDYQCCCRAGLGRFRRCAGSTWRSSRACRDTGRRYRRCGRSVGWRLLNCAGRRRWRDLHRRGHRHVGRFHRFSRRGRSRSGLARLF